MSNVLKQPLLRANTGKGKALFELLKVELGLPEDLRAFTLRMAYDDLTTVTCEYLPRDSGEDLAAAAARLIGPATAALLSRETS